MKRSQKAIARRSSLTAEMPVAPRRKSYLSTLISGFRLRSISAWATVAGTGAGWSGKVSSAEVAMQLSAVFAAVRRYGETVGSLPLHFYRWTDNGPERVEDTDSSAIITESPNAEQTPMEFWEGMQGCVDLTGDMIAIKEKIGDRTIGLRSVDPRPPACEIRRLQSGGLEYAITEDGVRRVYSQDRILHIRGFALGGVRGISPVQVGAGSLGLAMNAERSAQQVYKNGLRVSGIINTPRTIPDQDQRDRLQKILDSYLGGENAGGIMLLEGGMEFSKVGINPIDAELLTTRKFQIEEIGRWFDMPPILLGHAVSGQTMWGSGVDSIVQSWMTLGLRQRLVRIQQGLHKRLLTPRERAAGIYVRFNPDALLALNSVTRIEVLTKAIAGGLFTVDEARMKQDMAPVPGGDRMLAPVNLAPLDQLGENSTSDSQMKLMLQNWLMPSPGESHVRPEPSTVD